MEEKKPPFDELQALVEKLRDPEIGDPWILEQDFNSLALLTVEEAYEFADSVEQQDSQAMCDELGDLILHIFLYAQIAKEQNAFTLADIIQATLQKQQRRKINVDPKQNLSATEALEMWESKKAQEKPGKSILDNITQSLPPLLKADKIQKKAASVGFDWPHSDGIYSKLTEEIAEFKEAVTEQDTQAMESELGDILFTIVNLARHFDIDPQVALRTSNKKFCQRFRALEKHFSNNLKSASLAAMDDAWKNIKKRSQS